MILFLIIQVNYTNRFMSTKALRKVFLSCFKKNEVIKYTNMIEVHEFNVRNLPSFKSNQDSPSEFGKRGLAQNKKDPINYIFGCFDLIKGW